MLLDGERLGHISSWDVSGITDMQGLFRGALRFNQDIAAWDVGAVTTFESMFEYADHTRCFEARDILKAASQAGAVLT